MCVNQLDKSLLMSSFINWVSSATFVSYFTNLNPYLNLRFLKIQILTVGFFLVSVFWFPVSVMLTLKTTLEISFVER